jgi:4-amino-4-deoxy-L-arabinose transferase-like glycosyltransferase
LTHRVDDRGTSTGMAGTHLGGRQWTYLVVLSALALLPGLGGAGRLTYHEAFVAQGAREILDSGNWAHPTIGGLPWLEKPPLPWWLVAAVGYYTGGVNETVARFPSAVAATALVWGVATLGARHYGALIGLLAGAIQATTAWTVLRGRLAEADVLLAALITWTLIGFDRLLTNAAVVPSDGPDNARRGWRLWRWAFFVLLGSMGLVKGIGFGAVLLLVVVAGVLLWQWDRVALHRLCFPAGWALAAVLTLAWPFFMVMRYGPRVLLLWMMHVAHRLPGQAGPSPFASEAWWEYIPALFAQALPWSPLALVGAWFSLRRLVRFDSHVAGCSMRSVPPITVRVGDCLLWTWAVVPLCLLAMATVKNAHYAISAQVPWSIWAALALAHLAARLRCRVWGRRVLWLAARTGFVMLALSYGLGLWLLGPWLNQRGLEWGFYESVGRQLPAGMPLVLLYDDWDRRPYENPFGSIPHDLAVRLFYLGRPAYWCFELNSLPVRDQSAFGVIGRDRDQRMLAQLGCVKVLARGPNLRRDRTYAIFQITRRHDGHPSAALLQTRTKY